jgi:hypothetical protein
MYVRTYVHVYVYTYMCMYVFTCVCMYLCMYVRMYVCVHVCHEGHDGYHLQLHVPMSRACRGLYTRIICILVYVSCANFMGLCENRALARIMYARTEHLQVVCMREQVFVLMCATTRAHMIGAYHMYEFHMF